MAEKTFIISEIGINHNGDVDRAKAMIDASKDAGCSAVKLQTYQTDLRVDKTNPAYNILKKCELTYEDTASIKLYADSVDIEFISTPFDEHSLAFLVEDLGLRKVKLASFDVTNHEFLRLVNEYGKRYPAFSVIMSVGMASTDEIGSALSCLPDINNLAVLHCVSSYPTPEEEVNLGAIKTLRSLLHGRIKIGYSDHTSDVLIPALSVLLGASIVEKHFTLDLNGPGVDNPVSANPQMMKDMVDAIRDHEQFLGDGKIGMKDIEQSSTIFRRFS